MINVSIPQIEPELKPRITVFGVGGAGGNAVNNMIKSNLEGVDFVVGNTDAQALKGSLCEKRIQFGTTVTRGLGAGAKPDVGRAAAEEQLDDIIAHLDGSNMVFITAGMGGGTGTGAAPVIARTARERGILTVGVVTKPFHFEGQHRMRLAETGITELQQYVDTLIIIPNQNLFRIANEKTTFADAFKMADDVLHSGVRGVTDLMVMPGLINLDFADIRSVMTEMGKAMMGTGEAAGERRAIEAAEAAIANPLLDDVSMKGARGVLINITGGYDMTLFEVDEAANRIRDEVDPEANIIFGSTFDTSMEGTMRVSVVATGIEAAAMAQGRPAAAPAPGIAAAAAAALRKPPASGLPGLSQAVPTRAAEPAPAPAAQPAFNLGPKPQTTVGAPAAMPEPAAQPVPQAAYQQEQAPAAHVAGPLHGERRDDRFIAPRPAEAGVRPAAMSTPHLPPAPVVTPSAPPASPAPEPATEIVPRRSSLFNLVTGIGRRREEPAPAARTAPIPPAPPARQPAATLEPMAPRAAADEEMLDIPAFLRRQAN
jgi:cell division protein FtsZ